MFHTPAHKFVAPASPMNVKNILHHYIVCALWSSTDDEGTALDANYDVDDLAPETVSQMREDIRDFTDVHLHLLQASGLTEEQIGHDFWLTRNRHGTGFWDRGLGQVGDQLTKASHVYGEVYLYVGDDSKIHGG